MRIKAHRSSPKVDMQAFRAPVDAALLELDDADVAAAEKRVEEMERVLRDRNVPEDQIAAQVAAYAHWRS
jgi:hypothetical protein